MGLSAEAGLSWNRNGKVEGSSGSLVTYKPQYSARVDWAWSAGTVWNDEMVRRYVNANVGTYDSPLTKVNDAIPWEYRVRRFAEGINVTRSFGWATKNDFTFGAEMNLRQYRVPERPDRDPIAVAGFARANVPTSDTRVGPFVQYRGYTSNFLRVLDFETLGLQEDFPLGARGLVAALSGLEVARLLAHILRCIRRAAIHRAARRWAGARLVRRR